MQKGLDATLVTDPAYPSHNLGNVYHHFYGVVLPAVYHIQQLGLPPQILYTHEEYLNSLTIDFLNLTEVDAQVEYKSEIKSSAHDHPEYDIQKEDTSRNLKPSQSRTSSTSDGQEHSNDATVGIPSTESGHTVILPRWDYHVLALSWKKYAPEFYNDFVERFIPRFPKITLFDEINKDFVSVEIPLKSALMSIRDQILSSLEIDRENPFKGKILLIDRSPVSHSIHRSEFFKWRGYGKHSRSILNMDAIEKTLFENGVPVMRFTPGSESLETQIRAFASCKGYISLRGAELIHTLWMPKNSRVVVIETRDIMGGCSYSRIISDWLEHKYHEIEVRQGRFITINPTGLLNIFQNNC